MPDYGKQSLRASLTPAQIASANFVLPYMNTAVKSAEGNPVNFGDIYGAGNHNTVLNNSIFNNYARWIGSGQMQQTPFVDFMQKRWAPIGVANDPNNLNSNWAGNVRKALQKQLSPEEYQRWKRYNVAQVPWLQQDTANV